MTLTELRDEMRRVAALTLQLIAKDGELKLAMCHVYTKKDGVDALELIAVDMPDPKRMRDRDAIRFLICERVAKGDVHAIVFISETWSAHAPMEEKALVDQWRKDHGGSLQGSPWTRDTLSVMGSCSEGEAAMLTVDFDEHRKPGEIVEQTGWTKMWCRYTSELPWRKS